MIAIFRMNSFSNNGATLCFRIPCKIPLEPMIRLHNFADGKTIMRNHFTCINLQLAEVFAYFRRVS